MATNFKTLKTVEAVEADVKKRGCVDRTHLLAFLRLQDTNDAATITRAVEDWLQQLHDDPSYDKIRFADGEIQRILGDLNSYNRLLPQTIFEFEDPNYVEEF